MDKAHKFLDDMCKHILDIMDKRNNWSPHELNCIWQLCELYNEACEFTERAEKRCGVFGNTHDLFADNPHRMKHAQDTSK